MEIHSRHVNVLICVAPNGGGEKNLTGEDRHYAGKEDFDCG